MAKRTFKCPACDYVLQVVAPKQKTVYCTKCATEMKIQMPNTTSPNVTEVVDKHMGIVWKEGQRELVKERHDEYYWKVEVPRLVNSGVYSLETMLENGWVWVDDNEHIHTVTKPPHKR